LRTDIARARQHNRQSNLTERSLGYSWQSMHKGSIWLSTRAEPQF